MAGETRPSLSHGGIVQLGNRLISTSGGSVIIYKEMDLDDGRERQIFSSSPIRLLLPIHDPSGVNVGEKSFLLALGSRQLALFRLKKKKKVPPVTIDLIEEIVDIGAITVLNMERIQKKKEEVFRVMLNIRIIYQSGQVKIEKITVDYSDNGRVKKSVKTIEETDSDGGKLKFCVNLSQKTFFRIFEDTVVKSDGSVIREREISQKKKRRISVIGRELWNGKVLLATENGSIRVMEVNEGDKSKHKNRQLTMFSNGQCVAPHCTLRCREPTVIISTKSTVIVGTRRGEIHCLNENLQLTSKIDTENGPINYLKLDESDGNFMLVGYENGEVKRIDLLAPDENESRMEHGNSEIGEDVKMDVEEKKEDGVERGESQSKSAKKVYPLSNRSDTEMVCPECNYRTRVVDTFRTHLRRRHSTNVFLAGIFFLCECGFESQSARHSEQCAKANFTVIRKIDGPFRTFNDEKTTPQCILCKKYPKTALGYTGHLNKLHKTCLRANKIFLICSCGLEVRTADHVDPIHTKKCEGLQYSLHKLDEK